jgi:two-component system, OmpR family, KDP operon response regulator KdpE
MSANGSGLGPARILIVDDEPQIVRTLRTALATQGYSLRVAANGLEGLDAAREWNPQLVITDLAMPELDGVELCRELRTFSSVPIIVLSVRNQDRVKIQALDAGADDYVTKPFSIQELQARIRAQLRRNVPPEPEPMRIEAADITIDAIAHTVRVRGSEVHLTPKEFDLLLFMARNPGRVLKHKELSRAVWGPSSAEQLDNLRVLVAQLRKKIELPGSHRYIQSEPWVGYRFNPSQN